MLTPYLPYPLLSGGQIRTYNLLKNLQSKHDITLFAFIRKDSERQHVNELKKYCKKVRVFKRRPAWDIRNIISAGFSSYPFLVSIYLSKKFQAAIAQELKNEDYNLIHAETFYMMPNIPKTDVPIILAEQTIEHMAYLSYTKTSKKWFLKPFMYLDVKKIMLWEKRFWQRASRLITMSDNDRRLINHEIGETAHIDVVANGVDTDFFAATKKTPPKDPTILFVGTFKWLPNIDAVEFLVEEVWPKVLSQMPEAKLRIVGFSPSSKITKYGQQPSITVQGNVADIREAYSQANALLAPIRSGKGTRYKILEAMATSTPIIATSLAVEGIEIKHNIHALVADNPQDLAKQTVKLLSDKKLQKRLASNSKQLVTKQFNWQAISNDLDRVYSEVGATQS